MTGPIIRSKKSKKSLGSLALVAVLASVGWGAGHATAAANGPKLPVIQQVGVIPVQWEGDDIARAAIDEAFPAAVREAHRFHVLSDDLVNGLWQEKDGRDELIGQFELHSFASLTVTPRSDTVVFTARLLDPAMKTQILETDTLPRSWLAAADPDAVKDRIQKLVFRLINRIPVDVSVTSVQGQYITLSGGSDQGIQVGDSVDLVRATIATLHPANGTWLDFHKKPLGTAQVIETKDFTSVARLIKLTIDNAVEVGDGARIAAIAGRQKFARLAQNEGLKDAGNQDTIVVPPLYLGTPPAAEKAPFGTPSAATVVTPEAKQNPVYAQNDQSASDAHPASNPGSGSGEAPASSNDEEPEGPSLWSKVANAFSGTADTVDGAVGAVGGAVGAVVDRPFDDIRIYTGPTWWKISGKDPGLNSAGKFPVWLFNSLGGGITRATVYKFRVAFGGGGAFGKTPNGSWYGYNGYASLYWEDSLSDDPSALLSTWRAGGQANLSGMGVEHASDADLAYYGGGDWIRGGFFGGLGGRVSVLDRPYDWSTDFSVYPLNIGRVGSQGKFTLIESTFGYALNVGAFQHDPSFGALRLGGGIDFSDERMTLKDGKRAHLTNYALKAMAKYPLP